MTTKQYMVILTPFENTLVDGEIVESDADTLLEIHTAPADMETTGAYEMIANKIIERVSEMGIHKVEIIPWEDITVW